MAIAATDFRVGLRTENASFSELRTNLARGCGSRMPKPAR